MTVLQDELRAVRKELKGSAADEALCVAQPIAILPEHIDPAAGRYVAPSPGTHTLSCGCRYFLCDQEGHFVASSPIRAEMFKFMQ